LYSAHLIVSLHRKARMMRKAMLLTLLSVLALFACTDHRYPTTLVAADSLCAVNPDSALHLLTQYKDSIQTASKADRMYYHLLLADAMNKAYVDMSTDSILKEVADYYDRHGSANEQMRAHYLLGCAYRDMGEAPMALQCYQDAVDKADTLSQDCNYRLLTSVYGQMAEIFHKQNLPTDEIIANRNCQKYSLMGGDSLEYLLSIKAMIKPYFLLGDTLAMMKVLDDVYQLFLKRGDSLHASRTYGSSVYIDKLVREGRLSEARKRINTYKAKSGLYDNQGNLKGLYSGYYYYEGMYYLKAGRLDSAEHCFRKLTNNKNYHLEECHGLMMLYQQRRATDSIIKYVQEYSDAVDEQANSRRTETVHQMTSMYNYQRYQQQMDREAQIVSHTRLVATLFALGIVILLFLFYFLFRQYRQFKENKQAEVVRLNNACRRAEDALYIAELENQNKQAKSADLLAEKAQQINELRTQLDKYVERYMAVKPSDREALMAKSEIVSLFQEKARWTINTQLPDSVQWRELIAQFKLNLPTLYSAIGRGEKLSEQELRACVLLLLNFSEADAGILLNVRPQRLTNIKSRANQKLFGDSSAQTLIDNIRHLSVTL